MTAIGLPYVFGTMPAGNVPASDLDANFDWLQTLNSISIMEFIPENLQANVLNGTGTTDLTPYYEAAQLFRETAGAVVTVPDGAGLYFTSPITIGNASLLTAHSLICLGRATITFNISGHSSPCITMKGAGTVASPAPPNIVGRETLPCFFRGFDIVCQNTGLDGLFIAQGIDHRISDVAITGAYRNGVTLSPDPDTEIENLCMENVTISSSGQNGIMFWVNGADCPVNISRFNNINIRGFAINSVSVFGINASTQAIQLGCAIYALIMDGGVGGTIDGIAFTGLEIDAVSALAVANSSQPNPNAVVFANGTLTHVIWGSGVASSHTTYGDWHLEDTIVEDTSTGGFTSGNTCNTESGVIANPAIDGYWNGGTYCGLNVQLGVSSVPYNREPGALFSVAHGTPINVNITGPSLVMVRDNTNTQIGLFLYDHGTLGLYTIHSTLSTLTVSDNSGQLEVSSGSGTVATVVSAIQLA